MVVKRFDKTGELKVVRTESGFLRADAALTRTGVFHYRLADGSVRREFRPDSEVFAAAALESFEMLPLTLGHPEDVPDGLVDAKTVGPLQVGTVGDSIRREDQLVVARVAIHRADAVEAVENGTARELSVGYVCDVEETAGQFAGEAYDAIQRRIRGNHVAIVERGRAGPEARIRLDAHGGERIDAPPAPNAAPRPEVTTMKVKLSNGVEIDVDDKLAPLLQHELASEAKRASTAEARADAADAKAKDLATKLDAAVDPKAVEARVQSRLALTTSATKVLGADVKLDGLDDLAVRKLVVAKVFPAVKLDGRDATYVEAMFDAALAMPAPAASTQTEPPSVRADAAGAPGGDHVVGHDIALSAAWKTKSN